MESVETQVEREALSRGLRCMEVWGGNHAVDQAFALTGLEGWIWSRPHGDSSHGGDVFYVSLCGGGKIARFVLADVSGHGAPVARTAHKLRRMMHKHAGELDPTRFAGALNKSFGRLTRGGWFATALICTYFAPTGHFLVCNLGHPRPLIRRASDDHWRFLDEEPAEEVPALKNLPLGVMRSGEFVRFSVKLEPGDLVVMLSDGLTEARDPSGSTLGEEGLLRLLQEIPERDPAFLAEELRRKVDAYRAGRPPGDDETLIVLEHTAVEVTPPTPSLGDRLRMLASRLGLQVDA